MEKLSSAAASFFSGLSIIELSIFVLLSESSTAFFSVVLLFIVLFEICCTRYNMCILVITALYWINLRIYCILLMSVNFSSVCTVYCNEKCSTCDYCIAEIISYMFTSRILFGCISFLLWSTFIRSLFHPSPVTFPLDITKTRLQIQGEHASMATNSATPAAYRGMVRTAAGIGKSHLSSSAAL